MARKKKRPMPAAFKANALRMKEGLPLKKGAAGRTMPTAKPKRAAPKRGKKK